MDKQVKKCGNCGAEIPDYVDRCPECGVKQTHHIHNKTEYDASGEVLHIDKGEYILLKRHPFITVWLWLSMIVNFLTILVFIVLLFSSRGLFTATPMPLAGRLGGLLLSIVCLIGYILLLKGRRLGFSIIEYLSILGLILFLVACFKFGFTILVISPITSLAILYAVLQLKINGVSYWKSLK